MKKSNIGFPYPVLCSDNNDYIDSYFTISNEVEPFVENNKIGIKIVFTSECLSENKYIFITIIVR